MPFHHFCTILQEDGTVLAEQVEVTLEEVERGGGVQWFGTLTVTHLASLSAGQRYRLKLDDGRTGEFRVRRNTFAGGVNRAVAIEGVGALG